MERPFIHILPRRRRVEEMRRRGDEEMRRRGDE
jgi:hypothetical protein